MRSFLSIITTFIVGGVAFAQGQPTDGALGFQEPVTELARRGFSFHDNFLLWMCIIITLFVLFLLIWVMVRYNAKANPVPSKTTHNTTIEVIWTLGPVMILVAIAIVSFPLLYYFDAEPDLEAIASGEVTASVEDQAAAAQGWVNVKAQGNQWNWTYSYPDALDDSGYPLEFTSSPLHTGQPELDRERYELLGKSVPFDEQPVNLAVDLPMVVPAGRYIRYYTAAADVIHSFAMPSFGIKTDAVPGRLNEGWFKVDQPGVYYGQCSELCGKDHAFMPIEIRVVPQAQYDEWLRIMMTGDADAAAEYVSVINTPTRLASIAN
ncbi:MAG: cytochrome c oxidase subunit II [Pseudomonadota bacterium]